MKSRLLLIPIALVLALALVTAVALEGGGVGVLRTRGGDAPDGIRYTRVWYAQDGARLWIESGDDARPFLEDLRREPRIVLEYEGALHAYVAAVQPNPEGHQQIRRRLGEKYGWRDLWVGLLTDTSGSLGIVLTPPTRSPTPPSAG
ncbi:MAG: hypothetical protein VCC00_12570 [Deltaproteobacteria bacterium]